MYVSLQSKILKSALRLLELLPSIPLEHQAALKATGLSLSLGMTVIKHTYFWLVESLSYARVSGEAVTSRWHVRWI